MDNVIDFEHYLSSSNAKSDERGRDEDMTSAVIILYTGVRVEYGNKDAAPSDPSSTKRRTSGDG